MRKVVLPLCFLLIESVVQTQAQAVFKKYGFNKVRLRLAMASITNFLLMKKLYKSEQ